MGRTPVCLFLLLAASAVSACDGGPQEPTADAGVAAGATVRLALSWGGIEVTRLELELAPVGRGEPVQIEVSAPELDGGQYAVQLDLAPGTWVLRASAFDGDDEVASGEVTFEAVAGESVSVDLTLTPTEGEDPALARVEVVVRLCATTPVESVFWFLERREQEGLREATFLNIVVTLLEGEAPESLAAVVRWGRSGAAEVELTPVAGEPRQYEGGLRVDDLTAKYEVEVQVNGVAPCAPGGGEPVEPEPPVPEPGREFVMVYASASSFHTCGRRADGTVECWGRNDDGQCDVPPVAGIEHVTLGRTFTCGLLADQRVICWGDAPEDPPAELRFSTIEAGGAIPATSAACWPNPATPSAGAASYSVRQRSSSSTT